jgi:hypothetical protein
MPNRIRLSLMFFSMACSFSLKAEPLACPPETSISAARLTDVPTGWTTELSRRKLTLFSVRFYSGPPRELGELKGEFMPSNEKGVKRVRWEFGQDASSEAGIWMQCDYGRQVISMATRIPKNITECTDRYKQIKGISTFDGISCKIDPVIPVN